MVRVVLGSKKKKKCRMSVSLRELDMEVSRRKKKTDFNECGLSLFRIGGAPILLKKRGQTQKKEKKDERVGFGETGG